MNPGYKNRLIAVASTALVVGLAACGSSNSPTGPTAPTPAQLASFFDSIYSADLAAGTAADSEAAVLVAELLELTPALGGHRTTISVTTGSGTQSWYGFEYGVNDGPDSEFVTIAYSDNNLTNVLLAEEAVDSSTSHTEAAIYTDNFQTGVGDSVATVSGAVTSVGSSCSLQSGLAADALITNYTEDVTCQLASYNVSASVVFAASSNLGALQSISFSNVGFNGVMFTDISGQHATPGPTRVAGAIRRLMALQARGAMLHRMH